MAQHELPTSKIDRTTSWLRKIHWVTAVLVAVAYISINALGPVGTESRFLWANVHFWAGVLVICFTIPRTLLRVWVGGTDAERSAAALIRRSVHLALLSFLLSQPVLGILSVNAAGSPVILYGLGLPITLIGPSQPIASVLHSMHQFVGNAFYWVIALHIASGLFAMVRGFSIPRAS